MRNILLLLISVIGLAILRNLIREISRIAIRAMGGSRKAAATSKGQGPQSSGKLVRDPHTGTYVDPAHAVRAKVGGTLHYFESEASRDAFVQASA
jgi:hypothetical protein